MSEQDEVGKICKRIGYGRVMQIASDLWREIDPLGALTVGTCAGLVEPERARSQAVPSMYQLRKERDEYKRLAESWMADYDKMKAKYEPAELVESVVPGGSNVEWFKKHVYISDVPAQPESISNDTNTLFVSSDTKSGDDGLKYDRVHTETRSQRRCLDKKRELANLTEVERHDLESIDPKQIALDYGLLAETTETLDTTSEIARLRAELAATKKLNDEYYSTLLKRKEEHKALIKARQDDLDEIIRLSDERDQLKAQLAGATKPAPEFFEREWRDKQWQIDSPYDAGKWAWDLAWAECARRMRG